MKKVIGVVLAAALCAALFVACRSTPTQYAVTLNANYDGGTTKTETAPTDSYYYPEWEPERDGYYFVGWAYDAAGSQEYSAIKITKNTTLYATWEKRAELVTFTCKVDISAITFEVGDVIMAVATTNLGSTRRGIRVTKPELAKEWNPKLVAENVAGDITVTATRGETVIGKGSVEVAKFEDGATYPVTLKAAN